MDSLGSPRKVEGKNRNGKPMKYVGCDSKLINRIRIYLESCGDEDNVDLHEMVNHLQRTYREYRRKKKNAFKVVVMNACDSICEDKSSDSDGESSKTSKRSRKDGDSDDDSDFSADNKSYINDENTNAANIMMRNLYKTKKNINDSMVVGTPDLHSTPVISRQGANQTNETRKTPPASHTISSLPRKFHSMRKEKMTEEVCTEREEQRLQPVKPIHIPTKKRKLKADFANSVEVSEPKKRNKGDAIIPNVTFADVGGNSEHVSEILQLLAPLIMPFGGLQARHSRGLLLHGPPGCGKTHLANAIAGQWKLPFLVVDVTSVVSGVSGESENTVRDALENAVSCAPCILFFDKMESLAPKRETGPRQMETKIFSQLINCMDELKSSTQVLVIGATNLPDSLDPAFRNAGRFDIEINVGIPDVNAREQILQILCRDLLLAPDVDFKYLAKHTPGYVGADFVLLIGKAKMESLERISQAIKDSNLLKTSSSLQQKDDDDDNLANPKTGKSLLENMHDHVLYWIFNQSPETKERVLRFPIETQDFEKALKMVHSLAKREGLATVPDITWEDIGALKSIREELQLSILARINYPDTFELAGRTQPPGILLCGPPGCGKTMLAKAIANESGINFISVKGAEPLNKYVGESELAVRRLFRSAKDAAPCVIFFDEFDALCSRRSESPEGGSNVKVLQTLLTEMSGFDGRKGVFIIAATNRPDLIDGAILRAGRLGKTIHVGLPSATERIDILKTITKNGTKPLLDPDVSLEDVGQRCTGFSGADLDQLVTKAFETALKEGINRAEVVNGVPIAIKKRHFERSLSDAGPSVSIEDQAQYKTLRQKYCNSRRLSSRPGRLDLRASTRAQK